MGRVRVGDFGWGVGLEEELVLVVGRVFWRGRGRKNVD